MPIYFDETSISWLHNIFIANNTEIVNVLRSFNFCVHYLIKLEGLHHVSNDKKNPFKVCYIKPTKRMYIVGL